MIEPTWVPLMLFAGGAIIGWFARLVYHRIRVHHRVHRLINSGDVRS